MKRYIFSIFSFLLLSKSAFAVDLPSVMKQSMNYDYGMPSLFQLVFSMAFVIGLIYFTGWFYQKLNIVSKKQISKLSKNAEVSRFTVLQSMSLGQQRHIYTIEMNGKILLVGSTPSHINLIKEFDKVEDINLSSAFEDVSQNSPDDNKESDSISIDDLYKKYKN